MRDGLVGRGRKAAVVAAIAAGALIAPAAVQAYEVDISISGAGKVTETTPADLVGSSCANPANTPTGTAFVACQPGSPDGDYGWGWDVDYVATPSPGYTFVGWRSTPGATKPGIVCDRSTPAATTTTYAGGTCKFRTFDNLQTEAVFQDQTAPAPPTVGPAPSGAVNGPVTLSLTAPSDPTLQKYGCSLSGPGFPAAPSCNGNSVTMNPSQSGSYTFSVWSVDYSGNVSAIASRTFVVDKTAPETSLSPAVGPAPDAAVSSTSASFQFSSSEGGTFRCTLDGAPLTCAGGQAALSDLSQGPHTFRVWAVDGVGNADLTPAERSWTVDTIAPQTATTPGVGPAEGATTASTDAIFRLTSSEPSQFRCSVDNQAPSGCEDPLVLSHLTGGTHQLRVWAVDAAGNMDATPAVRHWSVSAGPPDPGSPPDSSACDAAKKKLAAAQQKLRQLKSRSAPARQIRKAKKRAKRLRSAMRDACAAS